ncbi:hypothetical protein ACRRTK_024966 [Alexandromys fortis]
MEAGLRRRKQCEGFRDSRKFRRTLGKPAGCERADQRSLCGLKLARNWRAALHLPAKSSVAANQLILSGELTPTEAKAANRDLVYHDTVQLADTCFKAVIMNSL